MAKKKNQIKWVAEQLSPHEARYSGSKIGYKDEWIYFKLGNITTMNFSVEEAKEVIFGLTLAVERVEIEQLEAADLRRRQERNKEQREALAELTRLSEELPGGYR